MRRQLQKLGSVTYSYTLRRPVFLLPCLASFPAPLYSAVAGERGFFAARR